MIPIYRAAYWHLEDMDRKEALDAIKSLCFNCKNSLPDDAWYCPGCGKEVFYDEQIDYLVRLRLLIEAREAEHEAYMRQMQDVIDAMDRHFCALHYRESYDLPLTRAELNGFMERWNDTEARLPPPRYLKPELPNCGVYIVYGGGSRYKIGLSDDIVSRMRQLSCGNAERLELIHVIESSNLKWCESFLHERLQRYRRFNDREWFELDRRHLVWLFHIDTLDPPRNFAAQMSVLDILDAFPRGSQ